HTLIYTCTHTHTHTHTHTYSQQNPHTGTHSWRNTHTRIHRHVTQRKWSYKRLNGIKERVMEEGNKEAEERPGDESPARGPVMEFSTNTVGQHPPSPEELTKPFCSL